MGSGLGLRARVLGFWGLRGYQAAFVGFFCISVEYPGLGASSVADVARLCKRTPQSIAAVFAVVTVIRGSKVCHNLASSQRAQSTYSKPPKVGNRIKAK